jgi:very-short-patch-repair endonuclease
LKLARLKDRARALRSAQTTPEDMLWRKLRNRQLMRWKFRRQHPFGRYIVDFVSLSAWLVIEIDGATHSTPAELAYDAERTRMLEAHGFHVVRFTNDDVRQNIDGVLEAILRELNSI